MSQYTPDRWVVLEFSSDEGPIRKVFAGWYGGYLGSDNWKLSSGITEVKEFDDRFEFDNVSGSVYTCYKGAYGMSSYNNIVLSSWLRRIEESGSDIIIKIIEEFNQPFEQIVAKED